VPPVSEPAPLSQPSRETTGGGTGFPTVCQTPLSTVPANLVAS
jgi:hypothetical protein